MEKFNEDLIKGLFRPEGKSKNGQITIIGGSTLFHGAPLLALTTASKVVDMTFFSSPEPTLESVASQLKSKLFSFIWVPWEEVDDYVEKSDAALIGPGFMRYRTEKNEHTNPEGVDAASEFTREVTYRMLDKFPDKKWVIDAGALQVITKDRIPKNAILTPNTREYETLFGDMDVVEASKVYDCTIVLKHVTDIICSKGKSVVVDGGNAGMAKGGTGDTMAGLAASLFAKNDAFLSAAAASFINKKAADELFKIQGPFFSAEDLANTIPKVLNSYLHK